MRWLPLLALILPGVAHAGIRTFSVGSFDRVRVEWPFEVHVVAGSPGAKATADQATLDRLEIIPNGTTLVVRLGDNGWGETPGKPTRTIPVVTLSTPRLTGLSVIAGAQVTVDRATAQRIDFAINGAGTLSVARVETDQLVASVVGAGVLTLGGTAQRARLMVNGPGSIGGTLASNDLIARVEGSGGIETKARFTAQVTTTGLGKVIVTGSPKCLVKAVAGGPVQCGTSTTAP